MPKRIQRQRTKGWTMPVDAVYVGRPSVYGNPWPISGDMQPWLALALGFRGDEAGRRESAVRAFRWWIAEPGAPFPVKSATPGPGDIEYESGVTRHIADLPVAMGVLMLSRGGPIGVPPPPALAPLRGRDLVCWCGLCELHRSGLPAGAICNDCPPCHADVLLEQANA